jgi:hypothetical protein
MLGLIVIQSAIWKRGARNKVKLFIKGLLCLALVTASLSMFEAKEAKAAALQTEKLTIAIVDTGVELQHADLKKYLVSGINLVKTNTAPEDDN